MKSRVSRATVAVVAVILLLVAAAPVQAEWNKGLEAYKNKDWATAVKEFEEVTKTNPDYAGAYYMLGVSQRALGQLSPAIASLRKAVELDGSQASYKIALSQALLQANQFQNAYEVLKPLKSEFPGRLAPFQLCTALRSGGDQDQPSGRSHHRSQRSDPRPMVETPGLFQALGAAQNGAGDDGKAYAAYSKAFELNSKDQASGRNAVRAGIVAARRTSSASQKASYYTGAAQVAERLATGFPTFDHQLLAGEAWLGAKDYAKATELV